MRLKSRLFALLVATAPLALAACSSAESAEVSEEDESYEYQDESSDYELSEEEKGDETRAEYEERQDEVGGDLGTYYGDTCTVNCGGHEAGREWAEDRGITDPNDCGGKSWSFQEGCETYTREQQDEKTYEEESDEQEEY